MRSARLLAVALVAAASGCASAPLEGAPRVESRRFTVVSDVDPGALELALPVLDAVDEELTRRWGFEDRGRRELLLFADEPSWDAFEAAEKDDGERWHGSGFGHEGAIALEVPPRSRGEDLSQVSFEQVRRLDDAIEVVSRVTRELFLCRLREHLGQRAFKARDEQLVRGAGELERTAAMARLDGGLESPYEPGRSAVERALGALAFALESRTPALGAAPVAVAERERALGVALLFSGTEVREALLRGTGPLGGRDDEGIEYAIEYAVEDGAGDPPWWAEPGAGDQVGRATVERLADVVLRHPSQRYVRAAGPTLRLAAALRGRDAPEGADPERWRTAAAALEAELAAERSAPRPISEALPQGSIPPRVVRPDDLDALLLELGVREKQRREWLREFCGKT